MRKEGRTGAKKSGDGRKDAIVNFFVGEVLRILPTANPKMIRETVIRVLEKEE